VILLSVYCTKTAVDIFTFYRFYLFLHCLSCVCQLFIKDDDDDDDDDDATVTSDLIQNTCSMK